MCCRVWCVRCSANGVCLPAERPETISLSADKSGKTAKLSSRCRQVIKKTAAGYLVLSHDGKKKLGGPYQTKAEALKRLRQVEFFKRKRS